MSDRESSEGSAPALERFCDADRGIVILLELFRDEFPLSVTDTLEAVQVLSKRRLLGREAVNVDETGVVTMDGRQHDRKRFWLTLPNKY